MLSKKGNLWYIVIKYKDGLKWKNRWIPTGERSKRDAKKKENDIEFMSSHGMLSIQKASNTPTLEQHIDRWLELCVKPPERAAATYEQYNYIKKLICQKMGSIRIDKITPEQLQQFMTDESAVRSKCVSRLEYRVLNIALKKAIDWKRIPMNPLASVHPPAPKKSIGKAQSITEVSRLIEASRNEHIILQGAILLGDLCGLRRGEMCGLRWQDWDAPKLHIRHSLSRHNLDTIKNKKYELILPSKRGKTALVLGDTKNDASDNDIIVPDIVNNWLNQMKLWQNKQRLRLGPCYHNYGFILSWEDGRPANPNWVYQAFERLLRKLGMPHYRVHDMRHTAATLLLQENVDIKIVSHQLRHSNVATTQDIYQHVINDIAKQPAQAMDKLFKNTK